LTSDQERDVRYLKQLFDLIYGSNPATEKHSVIVLRSSFPAEDEILIDDYLNKLSQLGLLGVSTFQHVVQKTPRGKQAFDLDCVCEIVLGEEYIDAKYRSSVFHLILEKDDGTEVGGTAFLSREFPRSLITALHVIYDLKLLADLKIVGLEDHEGKRLDVKITNRRYPSDPKLDLAFLDLDDAAPGAVGFQIAWDSVPLTDEFGSYSPNSSPSGRRGEKVSIFGFPPTPFHYPSLFRFNAEIESRSRDYSNRDSLMLSKSRPGCSGGPVVDSKGMVVGIVSDLSHLAEDSTGALKQPKARNQDGNFIAAVPSGYLSEISKTTH
jgi:hypothetical protein